MPPEITKIAAAFNRAASSYDEHARVQYKVGCELIKQLMTCHQHFNVVLDAGCGTGLITNLLARNIKYQSIDAIDIAEALLISNHTNFPERTQRSSLDYNNIATLTHRYDLIFSNMALQWSATLSHTLEIFHERLNHHGLLCFSIPLVGTFQEISKSFSLHPLPNFEMIENILFKLGYQMIHSQQKSYLDKFENTLSALRSIKLVGANHTDFRNTIGLRGKGCLTEKPIHHLTYIIGFFIAEKIDG
jgi:malonyl-CoA O-methyltransferase